MARHRAALPQLGGELFLADGGIETTLIFLDGLDLPDFAAFTLFESEEGRTALRKYFRSYIDLAARFRTGLVLESATWRASADWAARRGYSAAQLADANWAAITMLAELRTAAGGAAGNASTPIVISGCVGPRGDGYVPGNMMSADQAEAYHGDQIRVFSETAADMVSAITVNYVDEAVGITRAARHAGMPVAISFTVETDGRLPTGQSLQSAIEQVDAETASYPAYYMVNCAHPEHFDAVLTPGAAWAQRVRGIRANASRMSHAELNESVSLDIGDPCELGQQYAKLKRAHPQLTVMGGCCGTDLRHIEQIAVACAPLFASAR
ncbi:MAG: homocysteine S-methyltransferase family protein [Vicinamibacterales bacterium]